MNKTIEQLINNENDNYILPFFWQHGETEEILREYMDVIHRCGIKAVCVESRPHPDYVGPKWWHDLDIIIDEAKKKNMKVWILDDTHFPTGNAAGKMKDAPSELCKQYLMIQPTDICGPIPEAELNVAKMAVAKSNPFTPRVETLNSELQKPRVFDDDEMLAVVAAELIGGNDISNQLIDLTPQVIEGILQWDVPVGMWRIFVVYKTKNGGGRSDYINMLDKTSCHVQIDAVYEPHYTHYKEEFGKTIAGFFSDEPEVGNTTGFAFDESIGRKMMPLPWSKDMPGEMCRRLGEHWLKYMVLLWAGNEDEALNAKVRYAYMDAVTTLISKNFSRQIGDWCQERGVEYIGHIIEDNNQHSRLGCSMGHFFRSMYGQHMSGIDVIRNQVILGGERHIRMDALAEGGEGEFYHYALGKLGSSLAHIDPRKQGRAMCEIFGAYGWSCGVRLQKYLTDHFLVRGINYFVPHAFSPKAFPDRDCPPHFYAHGENPLYRHFGKLMGYMNRMCHIFNGGVHVAPVAMLYHGEAEWTGGHMFNQKPARELLDNQIDFDIIPSDVFADMDYFNASFDGKLKVNGETYEVLLIPYAQFITKAVAQYAVMAVKKGGKVIFVDALPEGICDSDKEDKTLLEALQYCQVVSLGKLAKTMKAYGISEVEIDQPFERLRYYHYEKGDAAYYMFSNEDPADVFKGTITIASKGNISLYDALENTVYKAESLETDKGSKIRITLKPYESIVVVVDKSVVCRGLEKRPEEFEEVQILQGNWKLSTAEAKEYPSFTHVAELKELHNAGRILPSFSGFMRYELKFNYNFKVDGKEYILIDNAYEGVEMWINDVYAGMKICPPYILSAAALKEGDNNIRIEVANTLYRKVEKITGGARKYFEPAAKVLEPSGIVGKVRIMKVKK